VLCKALLIYNETGKCNTVSLIAIFIFLSTFVRNRFRGYFQCKPPKIKPCFFL
jgi:hypothetical protein